jgi:hypothetical protein
MQSLNSDLTATLDRMTDYYRALLERMPVNTRKVFDALVRGGEPASQVEVAARIGAQQKDISRAFGWLIDWGYVIDDYEPKKKDHRYHVADRLLVQFYKMRYLQPGERPQLAILTDLLAATIEFRQKWSFAERYQGDGLHAESRLMAELACLDCGIDAQRLPEGMRQADELLKLGKDWLRWDEIAAGMEEDCTLGVTLRKLINGPNPIRTDEAFRADVDRLRALAFAKATSDPETKALLHHVEASPTLNPITHVEALAQYISSSGSSTAMLRMVKKLQNDENTDALKYFDKSPLGLALLLRAMIALDERDETSLLPVAAEDVLDWLLLSATLLKKAQLCVPQRETMQLLGRLLGFKIEGIKQTPSVWGKPEAMEAVLERNSDAPASLRFPCLGYLANTYAEAGAKENHLCAAARTHSAALAVIEAIPNKDPAMFKAVVNVLNSSVIQVTNSSDGIKALLRATDLAQQSGDPVELTVPWGILISMTPSTEGHLAAWKVLDAVVPRKDVEIGALVAVLAARLGKHLAALPPDQAFREGVEFFNELKQRDWANPLEEIDVSLMCFIRQGTLLVVIRDLLSELPNIFGPNIPDFSNICYLTEGWLNYLELPPEKRAQHLSKLDPDLATMIKSLEQDLSPKAREMHGIAEVPQ